MKIYTFNQRIENLFKSYFSDFQNIKINFQDHEIKIQVIDDDNFDSASLEIKEDTCLYQITFWDGYSQLEIIESLNEKDAGKNIKRFMKKMIKILNR